VDQTLKIQVFWDVVLYQLVQLDYPTLKMKALLPFDKSVTVYLLTQCNIPEDFNLNLHIIVPCSLLPGRIVEIVVVVEVVEVFNNAQALGGISST